MDSHNYDLYRGKRLELACLSTASGHVLKRMDSGRDRVLIANPALANDTAIMALLQTSMAITVLNQEQIAPNGSQRRFEFPTWEPLAV